VKAGCNAAIS